MEAQLKITCQRPKYFNTGEFIFTLPSISDPNKSTELMQRLVNLSTKQSGQKLDIDPMSGADRAYSTR